MSNSVNISNPFFQVEKEICHIREIPVLMLPEEIVRQNLLQTLLTYCPQSAIDVERPLADYGVTNTSLRIDIVIRDKDDEPFILIECKQPDVPLSRQVFEQAENYNNIVDAQYIALTNGLETEIYETTDDGYQQISLTSISELLEHTSYEYIHAFELEAMTFEETQSLEYVEQLMDEGKISPSSSYDHLPFYGHLFYTLMTTPYTPTYRDLPIDILEDSGYDHYEFGNASGKNGKFYNLHRSFKVKMLNGDILFLRVGMIAAGKMYNDPHYNTRKGSTGINVGVQFMQNTSYILELNLDKHTFIYDDIAHITHDGKTGGAFTNRSVLDTTYDIAGHLFDFEDDYKKLVLSEFYTDEPIPEEEINMFLENLLTYAAIRYEMKRQKDENKRAKR